MPVTLPSRAEHSRESGHLDRIRHFGAVLSGQKPTYEDDAGVYVYRAPDRNALMMMPSLGHTAYGRVFQDADGELWVEQDDETKALFEVEEGDRVAFVAELRHLAEFHRRDVTTGRPLMNDDERHIVREYDKLIKHLTDEHFRVTGGRAL